MAANRFASLLYRKTNKITLVLVYAVLEWTLIFLLLWNSLFSYLIMKFADYFGLRRPCLFCSRVDHVLDRTKKADFYRDLLCDGHAAEISKLGFCSSHRKIAESRDMCEDCSSSGEFSREFAYFPWMKQLGKVQSGFEDNNTVSENGGVSLKCSCCGVNVEKKLYSPCLLIKPDWEILDYSLKAKPIDGNEIKDGSQIPYERSVMDSVADEVGDEHMSRENNRVSDHTERENTAEKVKINHGTDEEIEIPPRSDSVPVEEKEEDRSRENRGLSDVHGDEEDDAEDEFSCFISSFDCNEENLDEEEAARDRLKSAVEENHEATKQSDVSAEKVDEKEEAGNQLDSAIEENQEATKQSDLSAPMNDSQPCDKTEALVQEAPPKHLEFFIDRRDCHLIPVEFYKSGDEDQGPCDNGDVILDFNVADFVVEKRQLSKEKATLFPLDQIKEEDEDELDDEVDSEENEDMDAKEHRDMDPEASEDVDTDLYQAQASSDDLLQMPNDEADAEISIGTEIPDYEQIEDFPAQELPSECSAGVLEDDDHGSKQDEDMLEFKAILVDTKTRAMNMGMRCLSDAPEIDEERVSDKPRPVDNLQYLHRSEGEDFLDDISVTSEIECSDGVLTMEKLKSALKAERQALQVLYAELEEERSASAVAANQTMAMINRLHEEKAAMQMEALQYQRMMEEQSEYDQEALQLLNELMVKKDRERVELEKELDLYRKKVAEYEAKVKASKLIRRTLSASNEDYDGLSIDTNQGLKGEDTEKESACNGQDPSEHENTPADSVLCLEESLADFEVERLSIIEQLKILEEKLITLNDDGEFDDVKATENGNGHVEANGAANGYLHSKEPNGKHKLVNPKTLLPLFDAVDTEPEDLSSNGDHCENGFDSVSLKDNPPRKPGLENKRNDVEEELDELYERLEALEADREFLRHCVSSLRKGDEGIHLLQEILQHLRDLRSVEVRARNMGHAAL